MMASKDKNISIARAAIAALLAFGIAGCQSGQPAAPNGPETPGAVKAARVVDPAQAAITKNGGNTNPGQGHAVVDPAAAAMNRH